MEELLKQAENGCNFLSMLEPSLSNIIKEIDNLKLKYHLVDTAKRNTEQSEPSLSGLRQNQTKDNSTQHEVTNNKVVDSLNGIIISSRYCAKNN